MLDKLLNLLRGKKISEPKANSENTKPRKSRKEKEPQLSEKELATKNGEPYIKIIKIDVDPANINSGEITLDWNDKFVIDLIKSGYKQRPDDTDQVIVDRWFQTVCRNIALEVYEQQMADPQNRYDELRRVSRKDIGGGRSEIS
jgi:hypothetical protein